jgi:hypothetical protein
MPVNRKYPLAPARGPARLPAAPPRAHHPRVRPARRPQRHPRGRRAPRRRSSPASPASSTSSPSTRTPAASFAAPTPDRVAAFKAALQARHLNTSIRTTRGDERMAACGQLGRPSERPPRPHPPPPGPEPGLAAQIRTPQGGQPPEDPRHRHRLTRADPAPMCRVPSPAPRAVPSGPTRPDVRPLQEAEARQRLPRRRQPRSAPEGLDISELFGRLSLKDLRA